MKRVIFLGVILGMAQSTLISSSFAAPPRPCPIITVAEYNSIPFVPPFDLVINGNTWGLRNNQARALNATTFSPPVNQDVIACTYNGHRECCNYNATLGGNLINREFEFIH